jgi:hypothetical protein
MSRRNSKHTKPKWEAIHAEDESRAETAARKAKETHIAKKTTAKLSNLYRVVQNP